MNLFVHTTNPKNGTKCTHCEDTPFPKEGGIVRWSVFYVPFAGDDPGRIVRKN